MPDCPWRRGRPSSHASRCWADHPFHRENRLSIAHVLGVVAIPREGRSATLPRTPEAWAKKPFGLPLLSGDFGCGCRWTGLMGFQGRSWLAIRPRCRRFMPSASASFARRRRHRSPCPAAAPRTRARSRTPRRRGRLLDTDPCPARRRCGLGAVRFRRHRRRDELRSRERPFRGRLGDQDGRTFAVADRYAFRGRTGPRRLRDVQRRGQRGTAGQGERVPQPDRRIRRLESHRPQRATQRRPRADPRRGQPARARSRPDLGLPGSFRRAQVVGQRGLPVQRRRLVLRIRQLREEASRG